MTAAGLLVLHVTPQQLGEDPAQIAADIAAALARGQPRPESPHARSPRECGTVSQPGHGLGECQAPSAQGTTDAQVGAQHGALETPT